MKLWKFALVVCALVILLVPPALAKSPAGRCATGRSSDAAMWLSILHPGLGEYHLKGGDSWEKMPERKFWLGFIPGYGWPGYLQVKSAIDAKNCRTNDELQFRK